MKIFLEAERAGRVGFIGGLPKTGLGVLAVVKGGVRGLIADLRGGLTTELEALAVGIGVGSGLIADFGGGLTTVELEALPVGIGLMDGSSGVLPWTEIEPLTGGELDFVSF